MDGRDPILEPSLLPSWGVHGQEAGSEAEEQAPEPEPGTPLRDAGISSGDSVAAPHASPCK